MCLGHAYQLKAISPTISSAPKCFGDLVRPIGSILSLLDGNHVLVNTGWEYQQNLQAFGRKTLIIIS